MVSLYFNLEYYTVLRLYSLLLEILITAAGSQNYKMDLSQKT